MSWIDSQKTCVCGSKCGSNYQYVYVAAFQKRPITFAKEPNCSGKRDLYVTRKGALEDTMKRLNRQGLRDSLSKTSNIPLSCFSLLSLSSLFFLSSFSLVSPFSFSCLSLLSLFCLLSVVFLSSSSLMSPFSLSCLSLLSLLSFSYLTLLSLLFLSHLTRKGLRHIQVSSATTIRLFCKCYRSLLERDLYVTRKGALEDTIKRFNRQDLRDRNIKDCPKKPGTKSLNR